MDEGVRERIPLDVAVRRHGRAGAAARGDRSPSIVKASKILVVLAWLLVPACSKQGTVEPPDGPRVELQLESLYLGNPAVLVDERLPAHSVSLSVSGASEDSLEGTLALDPNTCTLNEFGDPGICTLIATQGIEVTLVRRAITDPTGQGRRIFDIRGEGVPADLRMVVQGRLGEGRLERVYLVREATLVPLYVDER